MFAVAVEQRVMSYAEHVFVSFFTVSVLKRTPPLHSIVATHIK